MVADAGCRCLWAARGWEKFVDGTSTSLSGGLSREHRTTKLARSLHGLARSVVNQPSARKELDFGRLEISSSVPKGDFMKFPRRLAAVCIALAAPVLTHCSGSVSRDPSNSSPGSMDNGLSAPQPSGGVSFAYDIQPIFDARCTRCHNPISFRGTLDLTADNSYNMLVNQPTSPGCMQEVPDSIRVATCDVPPCDPSQSMLWSKTYPDARPPDGSRCRGIMPPETPGLRYIAPDEFDLLERWIIAGAPNN